MFTTEQQRNHVDPGPANSVEEVSRRVSERRVTWTGPLLLLSARSVLLIVMQAVLAAFLAIRHRPNAWNAAGVWWSVYGTLVDLGCILLLSRFTRGEGIRLRELIGRFRLRWAHDFLVGAGWFAIIAPFFFLATMAAARLVYGTWNPPMYAGVFTNRALPVWAVVYSFSVWWVIWSATEQVTYQGYVLPRLEALTGRPVIAVSLVVFGWALQHIALPFIFDWRYLIWRFLAFVPGVLIFVLVYRRTRRLPPLIIAHWPMDIAGILFTIAR